MPVASFIEPMENILNGKCKYEYYDYQNDEFSLFKKSRIMHIEFPDAGDMNNNIVVLTFTIRNQSGKWKIHSEGLKRQDPGAMIPMRNNAIKLAKDNDWKFVAVAIAGTDDEEEIISQYIVAIESYTYGSDTVYDLSHELEQLKIKGLPKFYRTEIEIRGRKYSIVFIKKELFIDYLIMFDDRPYQMFARVHEDSLISNEESTNKKPVYKNRIHSLNSIIYGAPGTGKTYSTVERALAIVDNIELDDFKENNKDNERKQLLARFNNLIENKQIVFTTFHQNYGYEDFIQGLRPDTSKEGMAFKVVDGVFKEIADKAMNDESNNYVIIIDEINRANISKVFGELITLIEEDKRWGEKNQMCVTLQSGDLFTVPNNLYIIGTMNSADKSISLIDVALRRRFDFIEQKPDSSLILDPTLKDVFEKINVSLVNQLESTDLLIGHSYFIDKKEEDLPKILNNNIVPLLYEYFYDNKKKVSSVLAEAIKNVQYTVEDDKLGRIYIERLNK